MLKMSNAYKQSMSNKFRNRSFMLVTIGAINQSAQTNARFDVDTDVSVLDSSGNSISDNLGANIESGGDFNYLYFSNLTKPFKNYEVENPYGTYEDGWMKADGMMFFPPKSGTYFNNGYVTKNFCEPVTIRFDQEYDIRGLTIDFSKNYPVDFTVTNGKETLTVTNNDEQRWITDFIFSNTDYLTITPSRMRYVGNRLRINQMYMGVGINFENTKILNSTHTEHVSPITEELPSTDFSMSVENFNRMFDVENTKSAINYLEIGQEVTAKYGYELDNGSVVWMDGCVVRLSDWSANDKTMQFSAKDKLSDLEGIYYHGRYYTSGITAYDLSVDVFTDAGLEPIEYYVDDFLKNVMFKNPLPVASHKECLQIIANASRCRLYTDRQGIIRIVPNITASIAPERMEIQSNGTTEFSNLKNLVKGDSKVHYGTFAREQLKASGEYLFSSRGYSPEDVLKLNTGFVSYEVSNSNGLFSIEDPNVTIKLEAPQDFYNLKLIFADAPPKKITFDTYLHDELIDSFSEERDFELETNIEHSWSMFDKMTITFNKTRGNTRIFLDTVLFGDVTDYYMDYSQMTDYPTGIQNDKVRFLDIERTIYNLQSESKSLVAEDVEFIDGNTYTLYFSNPSEVESVLMTFGGTEYTVPIIEKSAWFVTVSVNIPSHFKLEAIGKEYEYSIRTFRRQLNTSGTVEIWSNPLVSDESHAKLLSEWIGNYMLNNVEYEFGYRGEPRIEANDIVYLENKYVEHLQIQIYEHTLSFNGAIKGEIRANRAINRS